MPRPQMDLLSERKTINSSTTNTATTSGNQQTVSNGRLKNISEATVLGKQGKADQGGSGVQVPDVPEPRGSGFEVRHGPPSPRGV